MQGWANRIGLILQFLSLWLVTPQIIGEDHMLRGAAKLRTGSEHARNFLGELRDWVMEHLVGCIFLIGILVVAPLMLIYGSSLNGAPSWIVVPAGSVALAISGLYCGAYVVSLAMWVMGGLLAVAAGSPRRFLLSGGVLFTLGFIVLLWATWLPH